MGADRNECFIEVRGISNPQFLAFYAREQASALEDRAACELSVDRVMSDAKGPLYAARLTLSQHGHHTRIDERNPDAFLAVRDAFDIAKLWLDELDDSPGMVP